MIYKLNKSILILIAIHFLLSCEPSDLKERNYCYEEARKFVAKNREINFSLLRGLILEARGVDNEGIRKPRNITFTNSNKEKFSLPLLGSKNAELEWEQTKDYHDYIEFTRQVGIDSNKDSIINYINLVVKTFIDLDVYGIHSQLHLGEFVEFELTPKCSVWYKEDDVYLSESYKKSFSKAIMIKPNWYVFPHRLPVKSD